MAKFDLEYDDLDRLHEAMSEYAGKAGEVVNDVLHGEGAEIIKDRIMNLLPASGRSWKGKRAAASSTMPFRHESETLAVTVKSKTAYNYLYFPDDGSNTIHHAGNQQFMREGGESAATDIIDICIAKLVDDFQV